MADIAMVAARKACVIQVNGNAYPHIPWHFMRLVHNNYISTRQTHNCYNARKKPPPFDMSLKKQLEQSMERIMYASRWILAPVYVGMSLALFGLFIKFFQELYHFLPHIFEISDANLVLTLLSLIDLTLVGSLIVIVMFSGYENFVSRLDIGDAAEKLDWLGTHDYTSLKMKVATSIVAISSIHLLKIFMNIDGTANDKILWYVVVHLTLVISAFMMGYLDKLTKH